MTVIYEFSQYASVFVPHNPFQPSPMFAGKARAYPSVLRSRVGSFISFIGLAPESLSVTNALAD